MKKIFILFLCNLFCLFVFGNESSKSSFSGLVINNITSTEASCIADDGTATVTISGGVAPIVYAWEDLANPGTVISTTNPATGLSTSIYSVTVSDADGCTATEVVTVGAPPSPLVLVVDSTSLMPTCGIADGSIGLLIEDSLEPFTYNWENILNPGVSVSTANPAENLPTGIYSVTITGNNDCTTIVSANLLEIDAPILQISIEGSTCGQANGGALASIYSGGTAPFTYNWENNDAPGVSVSTMEVASNLSEGIYNVEVTDANGCIAFGIATITGTPPITFITSSSGPTCLGASDGGAVVRVQGGSFEYTYLWSNGDTGEIASNLPVGIHTLTITDTDGCVDSTQVELTAPESIFFEVTSAAACAGTNNGSIIVENASGGTPPYSYSADGASYFADSILTNLSAGTYDVYVRDDIGCEGITQIEVNASESASFETTSTNATCSGIDDGSITILNVTGGNPPYEYAIGSSSFSPDSFFDELPEGLYDVYVKDANDCVTLANQLVENTIELIMDYGEDIEIDYGETVNFFPTTNFPLDATLYTWTWMPDSTLVFDDFPYNPSVQPATTTTYNVSVMDNNGCSVNDAITVRVNVKRDVFIPNVFSPNFDGNNDAFTVFGGIGVARINTFQVYNRWGAKMHEATNFSPGDSDAAWDGTFRGNPAAQGVYVYYVEVEFVNGTLDTYRGDVTIVR